MSNLKISDKGKALLKNKALSALVAKAIIKGGNKLYSSEGIAVKVGEKTVTIKGSGQLH